MRRPLGRRPCKVCVVAHAAITTIVKGTRCLGSVELVFEKRSGTVCYKIDMVRKMLVKVEYNVLHKYAWNWSAVYGSQNFDSRKWQTVLVSDVK